MAPGDISPARRVATFDDLAQAGDYTGPHLVSGYPEGEWPSVWYLLPIHHGTDKFDRPDQGSGVHGCTEPPWTFRECPDGSLEIRASIGCGVQPYYWHGYLDEGNRWREV
jgi:hypothetical protein